MFSLKTMLPLNIITSILVTSFILVCWSAVVWPAQHSSDEVCWTTTTRWHTLIMNVKKSTHALWIGQLPFQHSLVMELREVMTLGLFDLLSACVGSSLLFRCVPGYKADYTVYTGNCCSTDCVHDILLHHCLAVYLTINALPGSVHGI